MIGYSGRYVLGNCSPNRYSSADIPQIVMTSLLVLVCIYKENYFFTCLSAYLEYRLTLVNK